MFKCKGRFVMETEFRKIGYVQVDRLLINAVVRQTRSEEKVSGLGQSRSYSFFVEFVDLGIFTDFIFLEKY